MVLDKIRGRTPSRAANPSQSAARVRTLGASLRTRSEQLGAIGARS